ncbi:GL10509 [Drosophila persimilis]|uniref:GL10509 n=1 Tax=Drosophila persimilis TaxID=7234 RepID=B4GBN2_DROPE|nr:GL10509 [Drosophila persimilis]
MSMASLGVSGIFMVGCCVAAQIARLPFNFSGGYFNPVLATALKWGCRGHTNFEHIIVYWIGACVGAVLSVPIYKLPIVRRFLLGEDKPKQD